MKIKQENEFTDAYVTASVRIGKHDLQVSHGTWVVQTVEVGPYTNGKVLFIKYGIDIQAAADTMEATDMVVLVDDGLVPVSIGGVDLAFETARGDGVFKVQVSKADGEIVAVLVDLVDEVAAMLAAMGDGA